MKVKNVIPTLKKGQAYEITGTDHSFSHGVFERLEKGYWFVKKYMTDDKYVIKQYGNMKVKSLKSKKVDTENPYILLEIEVWNEPFK